MFDRAYLAAAGGKFRHTLKDDWKDAWKWLQTQLGAMICIAPELYNQADVIQSFVPPAMFRHVMALLGLLVVINSIRKKQVKA